MKVMVLISGGLDSMTMLRHLQLDGHEVSGLFVNYGQAAFRKEMAACKSMIGPWQIPMQLVKVQQWGVAPDGYTVWARNLQLISIAVAHALANTQEAVAIGCNADDHEAFPDCRVEFLETLARVTEQSSGIRLMYPLAKKSKADIAALAVSLGVNIEDTWSCYGGGPEPCGQCLSCLQRPKGG